MSKKLDEYFAAMPVVAILRGVKPDEVLAIADALLRAGIRIIEVPLNSPQPLESIRRLGDALREECVIGAGTVLSVADAEAVAAAGGEITVTPNTDTAVIRRSLELGMTPMPGWGSATEAFAAWHAGARYLKCFPASTYGPAHVKALRAVLPAEARILAVGGTGPETLQSWYNAGVDGFGIATQLYRPGDDADTVSAAAQAIADAWRAIDPSR